MNIGNKWDNQIVAQFEGLIQHGQSGQALYRFWTNNCSQKAWDVLRNSGVFDGRLPMPKTFAPDQMYEEFKFYQKSENLYKNVINGSYDVLIKSITNDYKVEPLSLSVRNSW